MLVAYDSRVASVGTYCGKLRHVVGQFSLNGRGKVFDGDKHFHCSDCAIRNSWSEGHSNWSKATHEINTILLTTETAPNLNITKRVEIVTAEYAFGMMSASTVYH